MPETCAVGASYPLRLVGYNKNTHYCCGNKLRSLSNVLPGDACCGDKLFNSNSHGCCAGNIIERGISLYCNLIYKLN